MTSPPEDIKQLTAVIIVNWNGYSDTIACLKSLWKMSCKDFKVFICDNGSRDGSVKHITNYCESQNDCKFSIINQPGEDTDYESDVILIDSGENLGFAGGNNRAISVARLMEKQNSLFFKTYWLLNNDTEVDPDALGALVQRMQSQNYAAIVGSRLMYHHAPDTVQALGGCSYNPCFGLARSIGLGKGISDLPSVEEVEKELAYIVGASFFIPASLIEEHGLMSQDYFLYFEEIDWCIRAKNYKLCYAHDSVVYHKEGASIGSSADTRKTSLLADYFLFKNKLKFTANFFPYFLPTVWACTLLQALNRLRRGQIDKFNLLIKVLAGGENPDYERLRRGI